MHAAALIQHVEKDGNYYSGTYKVLLTLNLHYGYVPLRYRLVNSYCMEI